MWARLRRGGTADHSGEWDLLAAEYALPVRSSGVLSGGWAEVLSLGTLPAEAGRLEDVGLPLPQHLGTTAVAAARFTLELHRNLRRAFAITESTLAEEKMMTSDEVSKIIANGVENRARTLIMTGEGKLTVALSKFIPGILDKLVYNVFAKEKDSLLK